MGGLGSGRRRTRTSVADCRVIEIGELCDAGRCASQPRGEIRWLGERTGVMRARLSYTIAEQRWPGGDVLLTLTLRYRQRLMASESRDEIVLVGGGGRRFYGECPFCERPVRKLYAPPGEEHFLCRSCHRLVYRRVPQQEARAALADAEAAMGSLLEGLYELSPATTKARSAAARRRDLEALLRMLEDELPLEPQELRIYCLRLAKAGLSLRQIAALVGSSKSSVARFLAAGRQGLDTRALLAERLQRYRAFPAMPLGDDPKALDEHANMIARHVRRFRLNRAPRSEPEERVLIAEGANHEVSAAGEEPI